MAFYPYEIYNFYRPFLAHHYMYYMLSLLICANILIFSL